MNESFLKYSDKSGKIDIIKKCDKEKKFNSIVTDLKVSLMYYKYKLENKIMKSPKLDENFLKEIQNLVEKNKKIFKGRKSKFRLYLFMMMIQELF